MPETDPAAEQKKAEQRGQQAMSLAFQDALTENASIRIQLKSKDLLIQELQAEKAHNAAEIARLTAKLEEAGIDVQDKPAEEGKPAAKPNRRTRRAAAKRAPKAAPKANGQAEADAGA